MVHLVKERRGNSEYLRLQKSVHIKGAGQKKKTKHVAYLGRADKYTAEQLDTIMWLYED